jgi:hypothetical protein
MVEQGASLVAAKSAALVIWGRSAPHLHSRSLLASMCQYGLRDRWEDHLHGNDGQWERGA